MKPCPFNEDDIVPVREKHSAKEKYKKKKKKKNPRDQRIARMRRLGEIMVCGVRSRTIPPPTLVTALPRKGDNFKRFPGPMVRKVVILGNTLRKCFKKIVKKKKIKIKIIMIMMMKEVCELTRKQALEAEISGAKCFSSGGQA